MSCFSDAGEGAGDAGTNGRIWSAMVCDALPWLHGRGTGEDLTAGDWGFCDAGANLRFWRGFWRFSVNFRVIWVDLGRFYCNFDDFQ